MAAAKKLLAITLVLGFGLTAQAWAQAAEAEEALSRGKKQMAAAVTRWNPAGMVEARRLFEMATQLQSVAALAHYYAGYASYRLSTFYLPQEKAKALEHMNDAIAHLEKAVERDAGLAEAHALLSGCYGQKIGLDPRLGMSLGPKSAKVMATAKRLQPNNPRVLLLEAIGLYFTPPAFGGSKEKALAGFQKAAESFAAWQPADSLQPAWGHEEVYAWIGLVHLERGEAISAKRAFEKALAINPEYAWVKNELLPKVVKKLAEEKFNH